MYLEKEPELKLLVFLEYEPQLKSWYAVAGFGATEKFIDSESSFQNDSISSVSQMLLEMSYVFHATWQRNWPKDTNHPKQHHYKSKKEQVWMRRKSFKKFLLQKFSIATCSSKKFLPHQLRTSIFSKSETLFSNDKKFLIDLLVTGWSRL